ncbi:MAG: HAMP domain-containing histidine kinase [Acidimicrobiia bacterium]|nr:HAMP domain-containing histidine kinase [Acidimicrobiia bacterium]
MKGDRTTPGRWGKLRSVRARTTLAATAVVAVALVAAVAALATAVEQTLVRRVLEQGEREVEAVVDRLAAGATPDQALQPNQPSPAIGGVISTYVAIVDQEGAPVVGSGFFDMEGVEDVSVGFSSGPAPLNEEPRVVRVGTSDLAIAQRSIEIDGEDLLVVAASPMAGVIRSVDAVIRASSIGVPLLVGLVAAVTWIATGRTMRPIDVIREEVEELSSKTLDRRVPVPATDDEVARLAETMNRMLTRLETASARQREFVSDASHELRSPVASIRAEVEVALAHPAASSWLVVAAGVLSETGRLERIIENLLLLARLDEDTPPSDNVVDISGLIDEMIERIDEAVVSIETDVDEGLSVPGRSDELQSVIRNLLDNAVRHATSTVAVTATTVERTIRITVDDDGPGIPPADRERVFQRFTRLEPSRNRSDGGVGLGLAVVSRVVRHHGGSVAVQDSPSGGARFIVELSAVEPFPARGGTGQSSA